MLVHCVCGKVFQCYNANKQHLKYTLFRLFYYTEYIKNLTALLCFRAETYFSEPMSQLRVLFIS